MNGNAKYSHTQTSPLAMLLVIVALGMMGLVWGLREEPGAVWVTCLVAVLIALVAGCVQRLTVSGEESELLVQFGPIPLFGQRIPYSSMESVEASRSALIDGWGIHYVPGRGWTYNIWGFDCVLIQRNGKSPVRVGTDDADGLVAFLRAKINQAQ